MNLTNDSVMLCFFSSFKCDTFYSYSEDAIVNRRNKLEREMAEKQKTHAVARFSGYGKAQRPTGT
jgi:hypothetical protein